MRNLFIAIVVFVSFSSLVANDMCEVYAKHMKGDESLPVKIGICKRALYEECEMYSEKKELCVEVLHYGEEEKIFALMK